MNALVLSTMLLAVCGAEVEKARTPQTRLYVRTVPPGAKVTVDGEEIGKSDDLFLVPPGVRKVTVELDGYDPKDLELEVPEGWIKRVVVELEKRPHGPARMPGVEIPPARKDEPAARPAAERPRFEAYRFSQAERERFEPMLEILTGEGRDIIARFDAEHNRLIVSGTPDQHNLVRAILEDLRQEPADDAPRKKLLVYPIGASDPAEVFGTLKFLLRPDTPIAVDAKGKRILAWLDPAERAEFEGSLARIWPERKDELAPTFQVHSLRRDLDESPREIFDLLKPLVPNAELTILEEAEELLALCTPGDHHLIRETLERLSPEDKQQVAVLYSGGEKVEPGEALSLLQALLPKARLQLDWKSNNLAAFTTRADHEVIQETLNRLEGGFELRSYPLDDIDPSTLLSLLRSLVPDAKIARDAHNRVWVAATPTDLDFIETTWQKIEADDLPERIVAKTGQTVRKRRKLSLVVAKDHVTFQGEATSWDELPSLLKEVPHRDAAVLFVGVVPDGLSPRDQKAAFDRVSRLVEQVGLAHIAHVYVATSFRGFLNEPPVYVPDAPD